MATAYFTTRCGCCQVRDVRRQHAAEHVQNPPPPRFPPTYELPLQEDLEVCKIDGQPMRNQSAIKTRTFNLVRVDRNSRVGIYREA